MYSLQAGGTHPTGFPVLFFITKELRINLNITVKV